METNFSVPESTSVKCGICCKLYVDPRVLACLHTFCSACIDGLANENSSCVSCPTCSYQTSPPPVEVPKHVHLSKQASVAQLIAAMEGEGVCGNCTSRKEPQAYCCNCKLLICSPCVTAHREFRVFQSHKLIDSSTCNTPAAYRSLWDSVEAEMLLRCPVHNDELLKYFCQTCETLLCQDCIFFDHSTHRYQLAKEAVDDQRADLLSAVAPLEKALVHVSETSKHIESLMTRACADESTLSGMITKKFSTIISVASERKKQLLEEVNVLSESKRNEVQVRLVKASSLSFAIARSLSLAKEAQTFFPVEVLSIKGSVQNFLALLADKTASFFATVFVNESIYVDVPAHSVTAALPLLGKVFKKDISSPLMLGTRKVPEVRRNPDSTNIPGVRSTPERHQEVNQQKTREDNGFASGSVEAITIAKKVPCCTASVSGLVDICHVRPIGAVVGNRKVLTLQTRNARGENLDESGAKVEAWLADQSGTKLFNAEVSYVIGGRYDIIFHGIVAGACKLHVIVSGGHVDGSPYDVHVHDYLKIEQPIVILQQPSEPSFLSAHDEDGSITVALNDGFIRFYSSSGNLRHTINSSTLGFKNPRGIVVDSKRKVLYISSSATNRVAKLSLAGELIKAVGKKGTGCLEFKCPAGLCQDKEGKIYVAEFNNQRVQVLDPDLVFVCFLNCSRKENPSGVEIDQTGNIHVATSNGILIFSHEGRQIGGYMSGKSCVDIAISNEGYRFISVGSYGRRFSSSSSGSIFICNTDGNILHTLGGFSGPLGLCVDMSGFLYVVESGKNCILKF